MSLIFLLFLNLLYLQAVPANNTNDLSNLLHTAEKEGIINSTQVQSLLHLATEHGRTVNLGPSGEPLQVEQSLFMTMYNQLTLLNVLYFGGSLLIIGAYSLLMNIAWEHCNSTGISCIMIAKTFIFGATGVYLWGTTYQFLGGL